MTSKAPASGERHRLPNSDLCDVCPSLKIAIAQF